MKAKWNPFYYWQDLSLRWKLASILIFSTSLTAALTTEAISRISGDKYIENLKSRLYISTQELESEVADLEQEARVRVNTLGNILQAHSVDREQPNSSTLQEWLTKSDLPNTETTLSFLLITNAQGKTIAQTIHMLDGDLTTYPALAVKGESRLRPIKLPTGIELSDLAIFQSATQTKRLISGVEILTSDQLRRLGLNKQAWVGIRSQKTKGLPESKIPAPDGTYPIESGKIGLVAMAAYPLYQNNQLVGTVLAGTLLNRRFDLVDRIEQHSDKDTVATLFAQDLRIATSVPYTDGKTRSIGTRVAREVAATVLNRAQPFLGKTNIIGTDYETSYTPIFDHTRQIQPSLAKPVGIYFVGRSNQSIKEALLQQKLVGYGIGIAAVLGAVLAGFVVINTIIRPIRKLADLTRQIQQGNLEVKASVESGDEVGQLSESFNHMSSQLKESFEALQQAEENYRSIFENALEGIFQSSPEGRFINVNPALAKIYGYDSPTQMIESITNMSEQLYVDPEKRTEFREILEIQGTAKNFEYRSYYKDGSIIWTQIDARAVKDSQGNVLYYEGIVQDISKRKRREDDLRKQLEELKIEIDHTKREKEVAMLTESSFFQEVQQEMAEVNLDEFWS